MTFKHSEYLVETEWLAEHLGDPDLRILDCTVFRRNTNQLDDQGRVIRTLESGRQAWAAGHIPGSAFADLVEDLSDRSSPLLFMMPSPEQFAAAMGRLGVGEGTRVVCYDASGTQGPGRDDAAANQWAARVWWMLRAYGFDHAAVLNGGYKKWTLEGRPVSTAPPTYPPAHFVARPRSDLIAGKEDVLKALADRRTCVINALMPDLYRGDGPSPFGRPGRIAGSVNVPAAHLIDPETGAYLPPDRLQAAFAQAGALNSEHVITYCGGGIAASSDALILTMLGLEDVAVYDASLFEWASDDSLPMERG